MPHLPELSTFSIWAFGVGGLAAGLLGLLAGWAAGARRSGPGLAPALLGLTALGVLSAATGRPPGLGWPTLALAGLLLLFRAARSDRLASALGAVLSPVRSPRWQWAALAAGCPAAAALLAFAAPRPGPGVEWPPPRPLPPTTAVTDRGHDVRVSQAVCGPGLEEELQSAEARQLGNLGLTGRVIQVAPADRSYNCHGWVFAGGCYLMPDGAVEMILRAKGYSAVDQPEVRDLAVCRDDGCAVCHWARVWGVGHDGRVLLESKLAWMGRYLHPPEATPYGPRWTYYHSTRHGHVLRGLEDP